VGGTDGVEVLTRPAPALGPRAGRHGDGDVVAGAAVGQQRSGLGHHPEAALLGRHVDTGARVGDDGAVQGDGAPVGPQLPAPDGPNSSVTPGWAAKSALTENRPADTVTSTVRGLAGRVPGAGGIGGAVTTCGAAPRR
jgi:hypothetical protein